MKVLSLATAMAAMLVLIPAVPGVTPVQAVDVLAPQGCAGIGIMRLVQYGYPPGDPSDLNSCQRDCKDRFGLEPYSDTGTDLQFHPGGGGWSGTYYAYAQCIQDCNTAFWKDFDRKSRDLERNR